MPNAASEVRTRQGLPLVGGGGGAVQLIPSFFSLHRKAALSIPKWRASCPAYVRLERRTVTLSVHRAGELRTGVALRIMLEGRLSRLSFRLVSSFLQFFFRAVHQQPGAAQASRGAQRSRVFLFFGKRGIAELVCRFRLDI